MGGHYSGLTAQVVRWRALFWPNSTGGEMGGHYSGLNAQVVGWGDIILA